MTRRETLTAVTIATASTLFAAGCSPDGPTEQEVQAAERTVMQDTAVMVGNLATIDYAEASTPEEKFFLQFLDNTNYYLGGRSEEVDKSFYWEWKVGDSCLRETLFTTRDFRRDPGITAEPRMRDETTLVIESSGLDTDLVFEITNTMLIPGGSVQEQENTLGVLLARGCEYGPRVVEYEEGDHGQDIPITIDQPLSDSVYGYEQYVPTFGNS